MKLWCESCTQKAKMFATKLILAGMVFLSEGAEELVSSSHIGQSHPTHKSFKVSNAHVGESTFCLSEPLNA